MNIPAEKSFRMKMRDVENAFKYRRIPYPKRSVELIALLAISCTFFLFMHTNKLNSRLKEMEVKLQPSEFSALGLTGNHISGRDEPKHDDINTLHGTYQYLKSTGQLKTLTAESLNNTRKAQVDILFFNRVPKVGSQTVMALLNLLAKHNGFKARRDKPNNIETILLTPAFEQDLVEEILEEEPSSYSKHVAYIDFEAIDSPQPIYINMVRNPIERLISWFYYIRAPWYIVERKNLWPKRYQLPAIPWLKKNFETCILEHDEECVFKQNDSRGLGDHRRQMLFFCGQERDLCMKFNSYEAMQYAKRHVESHYAVVGTWEETNVTLTVLEHYIPRFFTDASEVYYNAESHLYRVNQNTIRPSVSQKVRKILNRNLTNEIEFYQFCKQRLYKQYIAKRRRPLNKRARDLHIDEDAAVDHDQQIKAVNDHSRRGGNHRQHNAHNRHYRQQPAPKPDYHILPEQHVEDDGLTDGEPEEEQQGKEGEEEGKDVGKAEKETDTEHENEAKDYTGTISKEYSISVDKLNNTKKAEIDFMFFNRVPKTGSQALMQLMASLGQLNGYTVSRDVGKAHETILMAPRKQRELISDILKLQKPHAYSQHIAHINFTRFNLPKPIYINMIRDPIERVISWHYYVRAEWYYADLTAKLGTALAPPKPPRAFLDLDLDTCVRTNNVHCQFTQMQMHNAAGDHRRQTLFFCGQNQQICLPFNSKASMQKAKRTVEEDYAVVGTWEDTNITLTVLEHYIPRFFKNAKVAYYLASARLSKVNKNPVKRPVSDETREILKKNFTQEIEFYEFCKQRLYLQYAAITGGNKIDNDDYLMIPEHNGDYDEDY